MQSIYKRLFFTYVLVVLICLGLVGTITSFSLKRFYQHRIANELETNALLVITILKETTEAQAIQESVLELSSQIGARITVIDSDGNVLGDSDEDPVKMENHKNRPEIKSALANRIGQNIRFSSTINIDLMYIAVPIVKNNKILGVVRLALPLTEIKEKLSNIYKIIIYSLIVGGLISLVLGAMVGRSFSSPLSEMKTFAQKIVKGDFRYKIKVKTEDEIGQLAESLNAMSDQLEKRIEAIIEDKNKDVAELKRFEKTRTEFIANVSHELKTPITSIIGFVETLKNGAINDLKKRDEFLNIIHSHSQRLDNLVNDILSLSRIEFREIEMNPEPISVKEIFESVQDLYIDKINSKKQSLEIHIPSELPAAFSDPEMIIQVFSNLIDNAIKFTPEKGKITLEAREVDNLVRIDVSDTGIGIAGEHLSRIFERFYRVDKARSREMGGTGLGLAIVKHIVHANKGEVSVKSELGRGSAFSVYLPKTIS